MQTITSKTAINGAKLWYVDGKRTSRDNAAATSIANGRENLSNLVAGLTSDPAVYNDISIVADMKSEFGDRYVEHFYFATAEDAVTAARKIVALGKQVHRLTIDNGRPYPSNIRYADTARGKLIFINGFERFNEGDEEKPATVNEPDADGHIDGYDESAFDLLPTVDELNDCRSDIEKEFDEFAATDTDRDARFNHGERHAAKLEKKLRELDPTVEVTYDINEYGEDTFYLRFGKYVYRSPFATLDAVEETFHLWREADRADNRDKSNVTNVMDSIFNHEHMTFNTHAEALAFIEKVANDTFEYIAEYPNYLIRDENGELVYATARFFGNVNCMSPDYGTYEFTEIITADGKLDHVIFQRGFGIGAKTVKLYIEAPTDDLDEALHRVWKRLGHKHRWHIGRDSRDDPYPYYLDEDGEEVEADVGDDDECREVEEQLGLIYADKRDYTGLLVSGWYAEDDPRLKDGYNESYSWREVESDYYRDVL